MIKSPCALGISDEIGMAWSTTIYAVQFERQNLLLLLLSCEKPDHFLSVLNIQKHALEV